MAGIVAATIKADLVIILSDIDGLYTDDPFKNKDAKMITLVTKQRNQLKNMAKTTSDSDVGTGGMYSKVKAANLINNIGIDMIITNGNKPDNMQAVLTGIPKGTLFSAFDNKIKDIRKYLVENIGRE